jgi:hypothetical protein
LDCFPDLVDALLYFGEFDHEVGPFDRRELECHGRDGLLLGELDRVPYDSSVPLEQKLVLCEFITVAHKPRKCFKYYFLDIYFSVMC